MSNAIIEYGISSEDVETEVDWALTVLDSIASNFFRAKYPQINSLETTTLKQNFTGAFILAIRDRLNKDYTANE